MSPTAVAAHKLYTNLLTVAMAASTSCGLSTEPSAEYLTATIDGEDWQAGTWQNWRIDGLYHRCYDNLYFAIGGVGLLESGRWELGVYIPAMEGVSSLAASIVIHVLPAGDSSVWYGIDSTQPGTVTLAKWGRSSRVIEGTFSFVARAPNTNQRVVVTNGRFRVHYDEPPAEASNQCY